MLAIAAPVYAINEILVIIDFDPSNWLEQRAHHFLRGLPDGNQRAVGLFSVWELLTTASRAACITIQNSARKHPFSFLYSPLHALDVYPRIQVDWLVRHKHESRQILPIELVLIHEHHEHIPTRHAQVLRG